MFDANKRFVFHYLIMARMHLAIFHRINIPCMASKQLSKPSNQQLKASFACVVQLETLSLNDIHHRSLIMEHQRNHWSHHHNEWNSVDCRTVWSGMVVALQYMRMYICDVSAIEVVLRSQ